MKFSKNLVYSTFLTAVVSLVLSLMLPGNVSAQDTPMFDSIKENFEQGMVFKADFTHRYIDSFTGETDLYEGQIWIGKDQYRIESNNQTLVVDGEISRTFDATKNRVLISNYVEEEDDFAPSRMLQGVDSNFTVTERELNSSTFEVDLESDDPFTVLQSVTITLNGDGRPTNIQAVDQADNEIITQFLNGEFVEPDNDIFKLNEPENAEVIDMRYTDS